MLATMKSDEEISNILEGYARPMGKLPRSPILHDPSEVGLQYEDVFFPSYDGIPLEGWFIPCAGSNKLIIANHPMGFSRAGFPSHLEPWKSIFGATGNTIEVNFVPDYKILHDAGYNVLAYDLRNFGHSGPANAQSVSAGRYESRDVIGSLLYARSRPDTKDMVIALFSRCLGFASTLWAMHLYPAVFKAQNVSCLCGPQPISPQTLLERSFERDGVPMDRMAELDLLVKIHTSFSLFELGPRIPSKSVTVPTFVYQVRDDLMTKPIDVQTVYDNIPVKEKKLFWIEDTTRRWDGYTYFQRHPDQMLQWFDQYMV